MQGAISDDALQLLMPQGVEHRTDDGGISKIYVVLQPLMPKGVEHNAHKAPLTLSKEVLQPLMPQGIEHMEARSPDGKPVEFFNL